MFIWSSFLPFVPCFLGFTLNSLSFMWHIRLINYDFEIKMSTVSKLPSYLECLCAYICCAYIFLTNFFAFNFILFITLNYMVNKNRTPDSSISET